LTSSDWIAIASVIVAAAAVIVAWLARGVARDANKISGDARDTAKEALTATRRQTALGAVPFLTVATPKITSAGQFRLAITNGGPTVAYGVIATVAAARSRDIDDVDRSTRRWSGRESAVAPGDDPIFRHVSGDNLVNMGGPPKPLYAWTSIRLEYHSPPRCECHTGLSLGRGHMVASAPRSDRSGARRR
jgi:hypothetical protein